MNPMDLRRGIQMACDKIVESLKSQSVPIKSKSDIENVAKISANGDSHIGGIIAGIFDKLGNNATVTVQDGKTLQTEVEYVEGFKWDRGYISPYFINDVKEQKIEMDNALVLLVDKKISSVQSIM